ncbi:MAG: hypothetical protein QXY15_04520 [Candidatus Nitrosotenuis sp.]
MMPLCLDGVVILTPKPHPDKPGTYIIEEPFPGYFSRLVIQQPQLCPFTSAYKEMWTRRRNPELAAKCPHCGKPITQ